MRKLAIVACPLLMAVSSVARADDKQICTVAYAQGQAQRDNGQLISARDEFRTCARRECAPLMKGGMVKECTDWLSETEKRVPSVVFTATRGASEVLDVKVMLDRAVIATSLDGRAVELDPGKYKATFEANDGTRVDVAFTADEGVKDKPIRAELPSPAAPQAATSGAAPAAAPPSEGASSPADASTPPAAGEAHASETAPPRTGGSIWKTVGYSVGAAGLVGLGVGGYLGLQAIGSKNDANCDANNYCDPGKLSDARSAATAANIAFGVGGALLVAGAAMVIFAPKETGAPAASVSAAPLVGANGGGLLLRGSW